MELTRHQISNEIERIKNKIDKQGLVVNERDLDHLDNLEQLYAESIKKEINKNLKSIYEQRCDHPYRKQGCCDTCGKDLIGE